MYLFEQQTGKSLSVTQADAQAAWPLSRLTLMFSFCEAFVPTLRIEDSLDPETVEQMQR